MKKLRYFTLSFALSALATCLLCASPLSAETDKFEQTKPLRIAVVSFKTCVEKSKLGQKEQANFDSMKKQMESILREKEKSLTEIAAKFNNIDYLDSLSPEAERDLKNQYRTMNQEFSQQQNQFYQTLSQANVLIVQKLNDAVTKAAETVATKNQIDLILNEESRFYNTGSIDISPMVIRVMDETFAKEANDTKPTIPSLDAIK